MNLECISRLARAGFMLNLNKTVLLVNGAPLLGLVIAKGCYCLGEKALHKLFGVNLPWNLSGL